MQDADKVFLEYVVKALVDNPNAFAGAKEFVYRFKLHDKDNILIVVAVSEPQPS